MPQGIRHFWTHIAGVKYWNADGTSRQRLIRELQPLVRLRLEPEPHNLHDEFAVRVCLLDGKQVGYLPRDMARSVSQARQAGRRHRAVIGQATDVTASQMGGQVPAGGHYLRVDILVAEADDSVTDQDVFDHLECVATERAPAGEPPASPPIPRPRGLAAFCRLLTAPLRHLCGPAISDNTRKP